MDERKFNIVGLLGFAASGMCFAGVGFRTADMLTVVGSAIWVTACIVWLVPLICRRKT
ncbi:MAG: hypothetical protein SGJ07_11385 [Rhodospirillaceae bacterium]|nr:hypothetical protein [Rhodospirillaceae bacterium]